MERRKNYIVVACCQLLPELKQVEKSMQKADEMLKNLKKGEVDLLLLPEMAFTGYVFQDRKDIGPFMEQEDGPTFQWCKKKAMELDCFVSAGYPLLSKTEDGKEKYFNSLCFVSPKGDLIKTYSKHFLYETDKTWADEGPEFCSFEIPEWKARVGVGICMDINPWEYKEFELYEFANYHLKEKSQIIILLANWLKSESNETSMSTQNYWAIRLAPLFKKKVSFVACNRVGTEKGSIFCGGSCVITLDKPALAAMASEVNEELLITKVPIAEL